MSDQDLNSLVTDTPSEPAVAPTEQTEVAKQGSTDPLADVLAAIKDEEGRQIYADPITGLKALAPKEQHIKTLEAEAKVRAQELEETRTRLAMYEKQQQVAQQQDTPVATTNASNVGLSEADIRRLYAEESRAEKQRLQDEANKNKIVNNRNIFKEKLVSVYGDKAAERLKEAVARSGFTDSEIISLAGSNPEAVLKNLNLMPATPTSTNTTVGSSIGNVNLNTQYTDPSTIRREKGESDSQLAQRVYEATLQKYT